MRTFQIVIYSPDPKLRAEFQDAAEGVTAVNLVSHFATDFRSAVEAVRHRRPELALVEMGRDLGALRAFAEEVRAAAPETAVGAVFHPEVFAHDMPESTFIIEALRAG